MTCEHCGGRVFRDWEDARDEAVLKCSMCSRIVGPPRVWEEAVRPSRVGGSVTHRVAMQREADRRTALREQAA